MKLVPVDFNPFEQARNSEPKLVPVDFNPFEQESTVPENPTDLPEFQTVEGNEALFDSQLGDENTGIGKILRDAGASLVTFNPKARIDGIRKRFPDLEVEEFGDNNAIIRNPENGGITVLNSEGLSMSDLSPFLSAALPGLGQVKVLQQAKTFLGKTTGAIGVGAASDAGFQAAEIAQGSEQGFDGKRLAVSAALSGALTSAGSSLAQRLKAAKTHKLFVNAAPAAKALKERASSLYKQLDDAGVVLNKGFTRNLNTAIQSAAKKAGFDADIHPKVAAALKRFGNDSVDDIELSQLINSRRVMQSAAGSLEPDEKRVASILIDRIDDTIEAISPAALASGKAKNVGGTLEEARSLWSRAKKSELLEEAVENAKQQASGLENGLRTQFRSLLKNKKKMRGFTQEERAAISTVVNGTVPSNVLKALGKFGFLNGQNPNVLMPSLGIFGGAAAGGPVGGVVVPLIGQVSKKLAEKLTQNNARLADAVVRAGKSGTQTAKAYVSNIPRKEWDAEQLSEILLKKRVSPAVLKFLDASKDKVRRDLAKTTRQLMLGAGSIGAGQVAAEEASQ